jgi:hypothetical protein
MRPAAAVTAPRAAIVRRIPPAKRVEMTNARRIDIRPCWSMKPTISGMLDRWHGLSTTLRMPQRNDAAMAIAGVASTALVNVVNNSSMRRPAPL